MGEVYLAHDVLMNKVVALKTPLCTSSDDPSAVRKFFDEARNADRITHANICRIYALQEHRDPAGTRPVVPFFTMEFIEGESLAARLKRGALPLATTRVIARQLLEGLRAAHEKRVLHLDFKSDNVMLRRGSQAIEAVIMDFGLSRERDAILRTSQYQRGIGTLPYMALEQLEGRRNLAPTVDVYAFGVVLHEMLTGRLPFQETSIGAMLIKQLRDRAAPPSSLRPELSPQVDTFVLKCLSRSPARRYEDARAALAEFERIRHWTRHRTTVWGLTPTHWALATLVGGLAAAIVSSQFLQADKLSEQTGQGKEELARESGPGPDGVDQSLEALRETPKPHGTEVLDQPGRAEEPLDGTPSEAEASAVDPTAVPEPAAPPVKRAGTPPTKAKAALPSTPAIAEPESEGEPGQPGRRRLKALPKGPIPLGESLAARLGKRAQPDTALESAPVAEPGQTARGTEGKSVLGASVEH
jgi:serine/threonine protein kinase